MMRAQAGFLFQLAIHRFQRRLVAAHTTLGELPAIAADAARPEHMPVFIEQDDADIRSVAIGIDHGEWPVTTLIRLILPHASRTRQDSWRMRGGRKA
jgi:hypothetical protein